MRRFVAFTDHHGSENHAEEVVRLARGRRAGFLVCGGDFSLFEEHWESAWRTIAEVGLPVYFVAGNHETSGPCERVQKNFPMCRWIGGKVAVEERVQVAGLDGTDDLNPHGREDVEAVETYVGVLKAQLNPALPLILVTHYPPAGTACCGHEPIYEGGVFRGHSGGKVLGSRVIREVVDILKPQIAICGHFHDRFGMSDKIGDTLIINPGPRGTLLELPG